MAETTVGALSVRVTADTTQVQTGLQQTQTALKQTGDVAQQSGKKFDGMSKRAGMAGIQLQQFVGQVQGGQNAMLAFGQQAADLGFVLGVPLLGAILGIAAALSGPLIAALTGVNREFEKAEINTEEWAEQIREKLAEAEGDAEIFNNIVTKEFQELNREYDQNIKKIEDLRIAQEKLNESYAGGASQLEGVIDRLLEENAEISKGMETLTDISTKGLGTEFIVDEEAIKRQETAAQQYIASQKLMTETLQEQIQLRGQAEAEEWSNRELRMREAFATQQIIEEERYNQAIQRQVEDELLREEMRAAFRERQLLAEEAFEQQLSSLRINEAKRREETARDIAVSNSMDALRLLSSNSKKASKVLRAASIVQAIVKGQEAAVAAWAAGMSTGGPSAPLVAAAYTAASLARTGAMIASLSSGSKSTSSGGGGTVPTVAEQEPAQAQANRNVTINLTGNAMFSPEQVRDLIGELNEQIQDGAQLQVGIV